MSDQLTNALTHHLYLKEQLKVAFPDQSDDDLADTLEGESNLNEAIIRVMRSADEDALMLPGIDQRVDELGERKARLAHRIEKKREIVAKIMERAGIQTIPAPEFTLSLSRRGPVVVITDETAIPAAYKTKPDPPEPKIDKKLIKAALDAKTAVPGAVLSNGSYSLTVRRK